MNMGSENTFKIDPSQLDQILANLCVNARDAIQSVGEITIETGTKKYFGNETILLVEDEPSIIRLTRLMRERLDYTILAAATPGEAIKIATESNVSIDMLLTDVVIPEMNGKNFAKALTKRFPDFKCLFMLGCTANVIAGHGVLASGVHFINKPFFKTKSG